MKNLLNYQEHTAGHVEDLRLAVSTMQGAERRAFPAEMTVKYGQGQARPAETLLGWGRHPVEVGVAEKRTGLICLGAPLAVAGSPRWEARHPESQTGQRSRSFLTDRAGRLNARQMQALAEGLRLVVGL